jgi:broad specificity phosphatase PhoE
MSEFFESSPEPEPQEVAPEAAVESVETRPHIRLEFFRHDAKTVESTAGPRPHDNEVLLTPEGRAHAAEVGKVRNPNLAYAIAYGSERKRSQETAMISIAANSDLYADHMQFGDVLESVAGEWEGREGRDQKQPGYGGKLGVMEELNFGYGEVGGAFHTEFYKHYLESKDALRFIYEQSDARVQQLKEPSADSYTRTAGNIASIVKRYFKTERNWEKIAGDPKHATSNGELQRHLGSHQGTLEPFLMKVIERREGPPGVDRFLTDLKLRNGNENGFGYSEGYSTDIHPDESGGYSATIRYRDQVWEVPESEVDLLLAEREAFEESIAKRETT